MNTLAPALDAVRLSLHVGAATVWVGGQITMLGMLPDLRRLGGDAPVRIARAFARVSWPAFAVLVATGVWNVAADHAAGSTHAWSVVLSIKVVVVVIAGLAAFLHQRATSKAQLAAWGSIAGVASLSALVLGILLSG